MKAWLEEQNPLVLVVLAVVAGVVGLVALVALTIVLAAVVGTFVLDVGEGFDDVPAAAFAADRADGDLIVTHASGDAVEAGDLQLVYTASDGTESLELTWAEASDLDPGDEVTAGEVVVLDVDAEPGDELQVVWTGGDDDWVLSRHTV